ncbi:hypothetical protein AX14_012149 [Amanita brunnescens Koide BX004]|nr:hypothetical protein AX14_012149 [Amanita brunnescens Koide BX004]
MTADTEKIIYIDIDSKSIKQDIQLLFAFEDMASGANFANVAWRVSTVYYNEEVDQSVPVEFKATLAFALASKLQGKFIIPGQSIKMNLGDGVELVKDKEDHPTFKNRKQYSELRPSQIRARNRAEQLVPLTVGFHNGKFVDPAGYIPELGHNNDWIATLKTAMNLYVTSDAKSGQTIDTISKSSLIYTWDMANPGIPDQSRWLLEKLDSGAYQITRYAYIPT